MIATMARVSRVSSHAALLGSFCHTHHAFAMPQPLLPPPPGETEGRAYAALTGDYNPIHVSHLGARLFGFKRAITHGMWVQAALEDALVNRNLFADLATGPVTVDVEFCRPIFLSSFVEMVVYPKYVIPSFFFGGGRVIGVSVPGWGVFFLCVCAQRKDL